MSALKWRSLVENAKYQIYVSMRHDPFLNLSIEHFLLQRTPSDSTTLFLYVNKPCVVIGRNQNPWLEVNLGLLKQAKETDKKSLSGVDLVRRRSGGGAVFHDEGNVNYSVICPSAAFTRDKHAEMVTRAIRFFNKRARVNERHDIVLDQGDHVIDTGDLDASDMHKTAFQTDVPSVKISGSAYKMTRQRSLHHGTCLLSSSNIASISEYLRSPARAFLKARGVESVRSPVGNVVSVGQNTKTNVREDFQVKVIEAFCDLYNIDPECINSFREPHSSNEYSRFRSGRSWAVGQLQDDVEHAPEIAEGIRELKVCSTLSIIHCLAC